MSGHMNKIWYEQKSFKMENPIPVNITKLLSYYTITLDRIYLVEDDVFREMCVCNWVSRNITVVPKLYCNKCNK